MDDHASGLISVPARRRIFAVAGLVFTAIAVLRLSYGDVLSMVFFGFFALVAFVLRWLSGKPWFEILAE